MVIISFDGFSRFLKADVVKSGEGGSIDVFDRVIGHEKHFLPSHKHKVGVIQHVVVESVQIESLGVLKEAEKLSPMLPIHLFVGVPFPCQKRKLVANDFPHETRRQCAEFFRQPVYLKRDSKDKRVGNKNAIIQDGTLSFRSVNICDNQNLGQFYLTADLLLTNALNDGNVMANGVVETREP